MEQNERKAKFQTIIMEKDSSGIELSGHIKFLNNVWFEGIINTEGLYGGKYCDLSMASSEYIRGLILCNKSMSLIRYANFDRLPIQHSTELSNHELGYSDNCLLRRGFLTRNFYGQIEKLNFENNTPVIENQNDGVECKNIWLIEEYLDDDDKLLIRMKISELRSHLKGINKKILQFTKDNQDCIIRDIISHIDERDKIDSEIDSLKVKRLNFNSRICYK